MRSALLPKSSTKTSRSPSALVMLMLLLAAASLLACNPFGGGDDEENAEGANSEIVEVNRDATDTGPNDGPGAQPTAIPPTPIPPPAPTEDPAAVPAAVSGSADQARNLVWAFLSQCVPLNIAELEAREIQGEWFIQAAGESPDKYGLWKADPARGTIEPHNIRARQWEPMVNQDCTPELFSGFFTPTPSPLLVADITEADQAVTTLWATLVNCYTNMKPTDLEATLNQSRAEWVVTTKAGVNANYGVWAVASDGTVSPKNRQAQGVFEQLDRGLC